MESYITFKGTFMIKKLYISVLLVVALFTAGFTSLAADELKVVATTEWTAAFCRAAGLNDVRVLAPATLQHPPDYELKPSDIPALMEADLIVFGGYEGMMERIRAQVAGSDTQMIQIVTTYAVPAIETSVRAIAEAAGTQAYAEVNLKIIGEAYGEARRLTTAAGMSGMTAAVHQFQVPFARGAGLEVVKEFGPAPPGPRLIAETAQSEAQLVLDNRHNPVSAPLREVLPEARGVTLINFPGAGRTRTLADVIVYNARVLTGAAE